MAVDLIFGNSHTIAFVKGHQLAASKGELSHDLCRASFDGEQYQPEIAFTPDGARLHPAIIEGLRARIAELKPTCLIAGAIGSFTWTEAMSMHERPFDFWVPALPEHPPSSALELIPFDLMMRHCRAGMDWQLALVRAVQCHSNVPIFHIEAPPPVENSEMMERHARMHAPTWGKMQKFGSTSASFRFKVWWAWTAAAREWCTRLGIHFITAPEETRDSLGFLQERYFADGIHGNDEYGRLMVHQVEKAKQRFGVGQSADG